MRLDAARRSGLRTLGITLSHPPGRHSHYIEAIDQLPADASQNPLLDTALAALGLHWAAS